MDRFGINLDELTWKLWMGLGVGSQVERGFSWERKGPLKAWVMALRLKAHTADAAILLLYREMDREDMTERQQGAERGENDRKVWSERGQKNKSKVIISTIIFRAVYMLAVNVRPYQKSVAASCVIKPFCNVFHPLDGSPIIQTCTKQALRRWLALAGG